MIKFGECKAVNGARVQVMVPGFSGNAVLDCLLMQPCAAGPSAWLPPAVGDVVVVAYDEDRPEDSVVLGVVYPDAKAPPKTGQSEACFAYERVYIGSPVPDTKCPRDDRVQSQLSAIKSELDAFVAAYNGHTHAVSGGAAAATAAQHAQGYSVGDTASDCVSVR